MEERGDWTMSAVDESALPPAHRARRAFRSAMDNWDEAAADAAIAGLARTAGANEIYETLFRYGTRDFRSIGHKAIYVANSCRTLQCIGWQHAEPVLRSLAYALLMHEGENPAQRDDEADRPYRRNVELAEKVRREWRDGKVDSGATSDLLANTAHQLERRSVRSGRRAAQSRRGTAVDLGCPARRRRRTADAPARDRGAARGDHYERAALRVSGQREQHRRAC